MKKIISIILPVLLLTGCDNQKAPTSEKKITKTELCDYIQKIKANLVFVEGGNFEMGDFGEKLYGAQIDPYPDSKPLH
ncbi:lipoprotein, partial [Pseudenterobacter timonensis]